MSYAIDQDPYCYSGTTVLINKAALTDQEKLDLFESAITAQRAEEPSPSGRFSLSHYCNLHRHLFQDVYSWAGQYRKVRIGKGDSMFCYPEHISSQMRDLFTELKSDRILCRLTARAFNKKAASFMSTLNAIHPFREGNGRTQLAFFTLLADNAGHPLNSELLDPEEYLHAMITAFNDDEDPLQNVIFKLIKP